MRIMKTTIITLALAAIALTTNAATKGQPGRPHYQSAPIRVEINHYDARPHADRHHCHHHHVDRYAGRNYCRKCGREVEWRGHGRHGYFVAVPSHHSSHHHRPSAPITVNNYYRR